MHKVIQMFQILINSAISKIINKFTGQYCRSNKLAIKETISSANKRRGEKAFQFVSQPFELV